MSAGWPLVPARDHPAGRDNLLGCAPDAQANYARRLASSHVPVSLEIVMLKRKQEGMFHIGIGLSRAESCIS